MKKNRPAVKLSCLCSDENQDKLAQMMLEHTTTLGVRMIHYSREVLQRVSTIVTTDYGDIRVKRAQGFGILKLKPEYDDVVNAAALHGVPFTTVYDAVMRAADKREDEK
jgi:uncharacterized protein (DUF111 family)